MILIIGAGLAGLSTAYHLGDRSYRVIEKEKEAGGLCRSYKKDGFTFDMTGHLLHFRQAAIKALVEGLLDGRLEKHVRRPSSTRTGPTRSIRSRSTPTVCRPRSCANA